jgi:hypothetical protein
MFILADSETGFLSKNFAFSIDAYRNPVSWFVAKGRFRGAKETGFLLKIWAFSIDAYRNPVSFLVCGKGAISWGKRNQVSLKDLGFQHRCL